jgi:cysteine-rich repeat protein
MPLSVTVLPEKRHIMQGIYISPLPQYKSNNAFIFSFLVIVSLMFISPKPTMAADVGGVICQDTVWDLASSPFSVTTNIFVCEGTTLTIEPGVTVQLHTRGIRIDGKLIAKGTRTQPITFNGGRGISFTGFSADAVFDQSGEYVEGSILQFCNVSGAGISIIKSSPFIDHCIIQNSATAGIHYTCGPGPGNDALRLGNLRITNNLLQGNRVGILNDQCGVGSFLNGPKIIGNVFSHNSLFATDMLSQVPFVRNLIISDQGARLQNPSAIRQNLFLNNAAFPSSVLLEARPNDFSHNVFLGNSADTIFKGVGDFFEDNVFAYNRAHGAIVSTAPSTGVTKNYFIGNEEFELKYTGTTTLNAENNWWGTNNTFLIEEKIIHFPDDPSLGLVDFTPFLNEPQQDMAIAPTELDFATVAPGTEKDLMFTVKNQGTEELVLHGAVRDNLTYTILSPLDPQRLLPSQEITFSIRFTPGTAAPSTGNIYVMSNDPDAPVVVVPVTGNGGQINRCGNSVEESSFGEECDDGNTDSGDGCSASCQLETSAICGNQTIEPDEQCDDGNTLDGDCCSATCQFESVGSSCDDGLFCTLNDQCNSTGECFGTEPNLCSDGIGCTGDTCNESADRCVHTLNHAACNDGQFCNGQEICDLQLDCQSGLAPCQRGTICEESSDICLASPGCADQDGDGEVDATDACPGTALGAEVDHAGCSLVQFCSAIDATTRRGQQMCAKSDWRNDEPLMTAREADCIVEKGGRGRKDDRCTPKTK